MQIYIYILPRDSSVTLELESGSAGGKGLRALASLPTRLPADLALLLFPFCGLIAMFF